jgi:glucose/arabinose dehydrogenase
MSLRTLGVVKQFVIALFASLWICAPVDASQLPTGFEETVYANNVPDPRAFGFLPDGRIVVACGGGGVYVGNGTSVTHVGTIATNTEGERGLNGLAVDPEFSLNAWIWVFYTTPPPARSRVSRFTLAGGQIGQEVVVIEGPLSQSAFHTGGCLRFDGDGTLFVSTGDDTQFSTTAQNPYDLRGKILHINRDGTPAQGNPYLSGGGDPRVWAIGLRNPYRFNIQPGAPGAPNLFIADVGGSAFEEIDIGVPGGNFGWANVEGPAPGGLPEYVYPIYSYPHDGEGASIIGGDHVRPGAFAPEYEGDYFFGDWVRSRLYRMRLDASNLPISVETWATETPCPADIRFGPDGALYYAAENWAQVRRIGYVGGVNRQPVAIGAAVPDSGPAPLLATLDGSASYDPEGEPLTATWAPGDGGPEASGPVVSHVYSPGVYYPLLTVQDPVGGSATAPPIRIVSGNSRPTANVSAPLAGARYNAGDVIEFSGTNADPEEGSLACSRYTWRVLFHHHEHVHPYLGPAQGACLGQFVTADAGESSPDTWYEIAVAVDDTGAPLGSDAVLTGRNAVNVYPNTATMNFATSPVPDLQLTLDTQPFVAPSSVLGVVNFRRRIGAPDQPRPDGHTWRWISWSDGGAKEHEIRNPSVDTTYTASFGCDVIAPVTGLVVEKTGPPGRVNLSWDPVVDTCLNPPPERYRIYASPSPRPVSPPGSFPADPAFELVGVTKFETFDYPSKNNASVLEDAYFLVVAIGTDQGDGPLLHYGE